MTRCEIEKPIQSSQTNPDPIDIRVGSTVRLLRCSQRISQKRLGEHLGVSFQQIQKYEKGFNRISAATLYRIALFFDTQVEDLFAHVDKTTLGKEQSSLNGKSISPRTHVTSIPIIKFSDGPSDQDLIELVADFQRIEDVGARDAIKRLIKRLVTYGATPSPEETNE